MQSGAMAMLEVQFQHNILHIWSTEVIAFKHWYYSPENLRSAAQLLLGTTVSFCAGAGNAVEHVARKDPIVMGEFELAQSSMGAARQLSTVWRDTGSGSFPPVQGGGHQMCAPCLS
jgi:hypothetical protein